jgi:DNA-binding PadR family transcriptional regulator
MTKNQFLILCALIRFPMHPYAVRQEVIAISHNREWPSKSTIRHAIDALLKRGFIESCSSDPHYWLKARRSEPYELTDKGRKTLMKEWEMYRRVTSDLKPQFDMLGMKLPRL